MPKLKYSSFDINCSERWEAVELNTGTAIADVSEEIIVPANSIVQTVIAQIVKPAIAGALGTVVVVVGDTTDPDGYLLEFDATFPKKTLIGNDLDELGEYRITLQALEDYRKKDILDETQYFGRFYEDAGAIVVKSTVATTIASASGVIRIWAKVITFTNPEWGT